MSEQKLKISIRVMFVCLDLSISHLYQYSDGNKLYLFSSTGLKNTCMKLKSNQINPLDFNRAARGVWPAIFRA